MSMARLRTSTGPQGRDPAWVAPARSLWAEHDHTLGFGRLGRHEACDVVIIGAGFTGLWTAHHLLTRDPGLSIVICEAGFPGHGASGRNGGWCTAEFALTPEELAQRHGPDRARRMIAALHSTVDQVGAAAAELGIDCGWHKGGTLTAATTEVQEHRLAKLVGEYRGLGFGEEHMARLDAEDAHARIAVHNMRSAVVTPHCAAVDPYRLVTGLAASVATRGALVVSGAEVVRHGPGRVVGRDADGPFAIEARWVVRATEAYGARLPGSRRDVVPVYSYMVATEPLPDSAWDEIGWSGRETFNDARRMVIYAQRTEDGRIAFGGRGIGYRVGSRIRPSFDTDRGVHRRIESTLASLFPAARDARITHRWGGPLGVPRDWHPSVTVDPATRTASAGGYVGDGVAASHLAGRTIAEMITGNETTVCDLPWVGHLSPPWEREPLRWLGMNTASRLVALADRVENATGRPARRLDRLIDRLMG
jgi:glycine/D-amino acid oxidase-like deaminating enzyme